MKDMQQLWDFVPPHQLCSSRFMAARSPPSDRLHRVLSISAAKSISAQRTAGPSRRHLRYLSARPRSWNGSGDPPLSISKSRHWTDLRSPLPSLNPQQGFGLYPAATFPL